jgi:hypothetical protein
MAKWNVRGTPEDQGPRPGEIRIINFIDGMDDQGNWLIRQRIDQFWDGQWSPVKMYHMNGNGSMVEVKQ